MKYRMHLRIVGVVLAGAVVALGSIGCEQVGGEDAASAPTEGTLAVVDLDAVARGLGKQQEWNEDLQSHRENLQSEYQTMEQSLQEQLEQMQGEIGDEPSEEDQRRLQTGVVQARQVMRNAESQANNLLRQRRGELIGRFRDRIAPIARTVADARGFDVVIVRGNNVLSVAPEADITQPVLEEARATLDFSADAGSSDGTNADASGTENATDATGSEGLPTEIETGNGMGANGGG